LFFQKQCFFVSQKSEIKSRKKRKMLCLATAVIPAKKEPSLYRKLYCLKFD
jgi:hypothetical protein